MSATTAPNGLLTTAPTPLVRVELDAGAGVWCKLEFLNPSGSTKDRVARYILDHARAGGRLRPGDLVIEASSGSTSIAMALACAQMGLRFLAVMPEGVSDERSLMIRAFGGEIRMTSRESGIRGAIAESERLGAELGAFLPRQFSNALNVEAHRLGTAREILSVIPKADAVVSGVGTGGTLVGLFEGCPGAIPVFARPIDYLTSDPECCSFSGRIPGVVECVSTIFREDRLPGLETVEVRASEAIAATRRIIASGYPVGPSSGLNYYAAAEMARRLGPGANVVTVFPDRMERYFSTELFREMRAS
ncbi:MAG TPA: cysteine synthase family protein [Bryobacteraceae bacterium]|nr:cysteine synthase family protein [Bryobacteraceae bacterium]